MKHLLLLILLCLPAAAAAQTSELLLSSRRQPVRLALGAVYQRYDDDGLLLQQASAPLSLSVPIGSFGLSVLANGAAAGGDALESVSGLGDVQVGLSYGRPIGGASVVASVSVNLPSGRQELTQEEFATVILLSQNFYDFRLPTLGQGFMAAPGVTVALPLSDAFAVGGGVAYQYKGSFTPLSTRDDLYDPGDELVLTAGADLRLDEAAALSADLALTLYGTDELAGDEYYAAGNRTMATLQYLHNFGFNELRVVARYSSRGRGSLAVVGGGLVTEEQRTIPNQGRLRVSYRMRTSRAMYLGLLVQGRLYDETAAFDAKQLVDLGALPELRVAENVTLTTRFVVTLGSLSGMEAGAGLTVQL